jgi:hypothetical protein
LTLGVAGFLVLAFCMQFASLFFDLGGTEPRLSERAKWVVPPKIDRDVPQTCDRVG